MKQGKLIPVFDQHGIGTDGEDHQYTDYTYIDDLGDEVYLVDYSYIIIEEDDGNPRANYDRWDYWSEEDFI